MRRFLLVLTVISFAGWSQPAQPQPQPPIVVQIQSPPANPWMRVVELVIPGIIGAVLALFGVWLTNRTNARTSEQNRLHDLAKLDRQRSFELKRDVLIRVTQLLVQTSALLKQVDEADKMIALDKELFNEERKESKETKWKISTEYDLRQAELEQATASARLAVTDDLWRSAQAAGESLLAIHSHIILREPFNLDGIDAEIANFTEAARKELGIVTINA
jgi:hypothetical protein